jgi:hypothetical protein
MVVVYCFSKVFAGMGTTPPCGHPSYAEDGTGGEFIKRKDF